MLVLIYAIMAVVVFAAVNIFFWKISFDLDKEMREEMRECGDCHIDTDETRFGKAVTRVCGFILSIPAADSQQKNLTRRKTNDFKLWT